MTAFLVNTKHIGHILISALRQAIIAACLALEKLMTVAIEDHMKLILSSFPNPITYAKNISIWLIDIGWWQSLKK